VGKLMEDLAPEDSQKTYGDGTWMAEEAKVDEQ
jgi:hypothetical protein